MIVTPVHATREGLAAELRFDAPPARVSSYLSDLRHMEVWWPEHRLYRRIKGDGGSGSLYTWIYVVGILPAVGVTRVETNEPGARFAYRAMFPGLSIRIHYRFTEDRGGTRADFSMRTILARLPGFAANAAPEATRAFGLLDRELARG